MAKVNVSLPQGTRDFAPAVVRKREFIINLIKKSFVLYGFEPLETPAMENLETLMGKYGEEGDRLIFKILNNGLERQEKREKARQEFEKILEGKNNPEITERALRYDLTIPFARFVAMNQGQLSFPFKRYQVQPVWRADRPQKGRYREFYQCDADLVGSLSLLNEVEFASLYATVFSELGIEVEIKLNNRKILAALAEACNRKDKLNDITVAIDKMDKIGLEKVKEELTGRGLTNESIQTIVKYLSISGTNEEKLASARNLLNMYSIGKTGIDELEYILDFLKKAGNRAPVKLDFTLARGLNYYTGAIFEVEAKNVKIGSIGGGGRYDDLTGLFGVPGIAGVGISFGLDRIYDVMEELNLFPPEINTGTTVLFFNLGEAESKIAFSLLQELRAKKVAGEIYPDQVKFDKQFKYAEKKNIPWVIILGSEEAANKTCKIKRLADGQQETINQSDLINYNFDQ